MGALFQDLRFAVRGFARAPAFTAIAVLTLAIGIGASSAIFSVVDGVVLRPLPFPGSDDLVFVQQITANREANAATYPDFDDWRRDNRVFSGVAGFHGDSFVLVRGGAPAERLTGVAVTADFFDVLGVHPRLGRGFAAGEDVDGKNHVAIVSHDAWQKRLGGDPAAVGATVTLDDTPFTVIGILPPDFRFLEGAQANEIYVPTPRPIDRQLGHVRGIRYMTVIARLKPGTSVETAQANMSTIAAAEAAAYPDSNAQRVVRVVSMHAFVTRDLRPALLILLGAVGFVLLIACANVANLLLSRATARHRELAIRIALGANRARVVRQLLTESVALALAGGLLGVALAFWGVDALRGLLPPEVVRLSHFALDARVLAFAALVSVVTGIAFGLVPALQASSSSPQDALRDVRASAAPARQRARSIFVAAEVALATLLLVGSALMLRSFDRVLSVDPGFRRDDLQIALLSLPESRYGGPDDLRRFYRGLLGELDKLPGAQATVMTPVPFTGFSSFGFDIEGAPPRRPGDMRVASHHQVGPRFRDTLGIPLRAGRDFTTADDDPKAAPVVMVNEALLRTYLGGESPLGRHFVLEQSKLRVEVIGVVGDVREGTLEQEAIPAIYVPYSQDPVPDIFIAVRTRAKTGLADALRAAVAAVDHDEPVDFIRPMSELLDETLVARRINTLLLGLFGAMALLLALIGIYGVMSYSVSQRAHEIGIRMALGARPGDVVRMVVRAGLLLAGIGVGIGLVGSLALARLLGGLLYGISPNDPQVYVAIAILLVGVAALASYVPARRAARVDPMIALRGD